MLAACDSADVYVNLAYLSQGSLAGYGGMSIVLYFESARVSILWVFSGVRGMEHSLSSL